MSLGSDISSEVLSVLSVYGRGMTLGVVDEGEYSDDDATVSGGGVTPYDFTGLMMTYDDRDIDGTRIRADDRRCIIAASGLAVTPDIGDRVTAGPNTYVIVYVRTYELSGVNLCYVAQVRTIGRV